MSLVADVQEITCQMRGWCESVQFGCPHLFDECGEPKDGDPTQVYIVLTNGWAS